MYSEPNDGSVAVASQLFPRARSRARTVRGFKESHTSILGNVDLAAQLNEELATLAAE
jgi:hypothetical protein